MHTRAFFISLLWLVLLLAIPTGVFAAPSTWEVGDRLSGWTLDEIKTHPEYLRLTFSKADERTQLEIVKGAGRDGLFCNPQHCVQPALGYSPPKPLLESVFSRLNAVETEADAALPKQVINKQHPAKQKQAVERSDPYLGRAVRFWLGSFGLVALLLIALMGVRRRLSKHPGKVLEQTKRAIMWALMMLPVAWLLIIVYVFVVESVTLNDFDRDRELGRVQAVLSQQRDVGFRLERVDGAWQFDGAGHKVEIKDDARPKIYVFGGSSVVVPVYNWAFPAGLQQRMDEVGQAVQVVNFGVPGYDSFDILAQAEVALKQAPPKLAIVYAGHNDFTNAYRSSFAAEYSALTRHASLLALALVAYGFTDSHAQNLPWEGDAPQFGSWVEYAADPTLIVALERVGLFELDLEAFRAMDRMIVEAYRKNLERLKELAESTDTMLLFVSPIGNLEAPVYSADRQGRDLFRQGMAASDYRTRIDYLTQARDLDTFSLDIRAKSPLYGALRQLGASSPHVVYFDLEAALRDSEFAFGFENFSDYVHFRQDTHARVARELFEMIRNDELFNVSP